MKKLLKALYIKLSSPNTGDDFGIQLFKLLICGLFFIMIIKVLSKMII
jgi:hypothetical protein